MPSPLGKVDFSTSILWMLKKTEEVLPQYVFADSRLKTRHCAAPLPPPSEAP